MATTTMQFSELSGNDWAALAAHRNQVFTDENLQSLFDSDVDRDSHYLVTAAGLTLDYSRNWLVPETKNLLAKLAHQKQLRQKIRALFDGDPVNVTEASPSLHCGFRLPSQSRNSKQASLRERCRSYNAMMNSWIQGFADDTLLGSTGKPISDIVNIGIGGSNHGAQLLDHALQSWHTSEKRVHYVSNQDTLQIQETLASLNPETTLFIIISKTFSTIETLSNMQIAKVWLINALGSELAAYKHLLAVTAFPERAELLGFSNERILPLIEAVGGRFSIWSSVSLSAVLLLGVDAFNDFLAGARAMDEHFYDADYASNMPIILAFIDIWYANFFNIQNRAIVPYSYALRDMPTYLQQLHMESLGKSVSTNGQLVSYRTGIALCSDIASDSQHSFHQLLLQGNTTIPVDFILPMRDHSTGELEVDMIANCVAQSEALLLGADAALTRKRFQKKKATLSPVSRIYTAQQQLNGNRPSTIILMDSVTPFTLGALIALYEHKIYAQSVLLEINAFDQWGVEHGKLIAKTLQKTLNEKSIAPELTPSTAGLMKIIMKLLDT